MANRSFLYYCGGQEVTGNFPKKLNLWSKSCVESCPNSTAELVPCLMRQYVNTTMLPGMVLPTPANITFVSTLNVEVTQSVALQRSYPTTDFQGRYCVPAKEEHGEELYDQVVDGPLKQVVQFNGAIASFKH